MSGGSIPSDDEEKLEETTDQRDPILAWRPMGAADMISGRRVGPHVRCVARRRVLMM